MNRATILLETDASRGIAVRSRLCVIDGQFVVDIQADALALGNDIAGEPCFGGNEFVRDVHDLLRAPGTNVIFAGAIDLSFVIARDIEGFTRTKVKATVAAIADSDLSAEVEVPIVVAFGEEIILGA